jgi:hypothetical protein
MFTVGLSGMSARIFEGVGDGEILAAFAKTAVSERRSFKAFGLLVPSRLWHGRAGCICKNRVVGAVAK